MCVCVCVYNVVGAFICIGTGVRIHTDSRCEDGVALSISAVVARSYMLCEGCLLYGGECYSIRLMCM